MLSNDHFVEMSWAKAYMEGAVRLPGVGQGRYPLSQSSYWGNDSEGYHHVQGLLDLVMVLSGYLLLGMLDKENEGVGTDGVSTRCVSLASKERGKLALGLGCHGLLLAWPGMGWCSWVSGSSGWV